MLDIDLNIALTNKEYHSRSEISKSDLDKLAKSPFHFKFKSEFETEPSQTLILGSLVHKLVLEPQDFNNEFIIEPVCDKRTKAGKEAYQEFLTSVGDKTIVPQSLNETAQEIALKVLSMKETGLFLKNGLAEQSYFGEIEGVKVKCRPDFYNESLGLAIDLKTTSDASATGFAKSVANFNYHIQASFYSDILRQNGKEVNNFLFIAVETKKPYMVGFYELDQTAIDKGRDDYLRLLDLYKVCEAKNEWWGYAEFKDNEVNHIQTLALPNWKFYQEVGA
ncbi:putative exonuclease VIII [Campylobacter pinnipediorum subsp. pinnipediorum]|uniref:PD-(D/E)XK nuclease-like domain-containing protein n=1 Tax=Campylobacter pinnipediorum TaxID=1965231 RepID=UPI0009950143|nr:PD-(D/E)XK nuclease-like domain-containing protein [Campylobacter pinnipediorum]AQW81395.1 putative exonuclease VIII [Campylobacter pinnipediorum subsp. pinnipediorum]